MSLKNKYKTNTKVANEGIWFKMIANTDGSVPAFKLAFLGKQNKTYKAALRRHLDQLGGLGTIDFESLGEEEADALLLEVFVDSVLLDWSNFQPDDNGVALSFSKENAKIIFGDEEWVALYDELNLKAKRIAAFKEQRLESEAKNS